MRVVRIDQFVNEEDDIQWLVDGLLPDTGWCLMVGEQGVGKTRFAMQMCEAMRVGTDFLRRATKKTSFLFFQADSLTKEWRGILKQVAPGSKGLSIIDVPECCLDNPAYVEWIAKAIAQVNPGYVVFDSLYNLTAADINNPKILLVLNRIKAIVGTIPWMLIHHPPQGESRAAGSRAIAASSSYNWVLSNTRLRIAKGRLVESRNINIIKEKGLWVLKGDLEIGGSLSEDIMNRPLD